MHDRTPSRRRQRTAKERQRRRLAPGERERLDREAANRRTYRARLAGGGASLKGVPITDVNALIEAVMDLQWLDAAKSEDRAALVLAVGALLDDIAKPYRRRVVNGQTDS